MEPLGREMVDLGDEFWRGAQTIQEEVRAQSVNVNGWRCRKTGKILARNGPP